MVEVVIGMKVDGEARVWPWFGRWTSGVKEYFWWVQTIHRERMTLRGGRGGHPGEVVGSTWIQGHQSPRRRVVLP